jgi:hypothetical protein
VALLRIVRCVGGLRQRRQRRQSQTYRYLRSLPKYVFERPSMKGTTVIPVQLYPLSPLGECSPSEISVRSYFTCNSLPPPTQYFISTPPNGPTFFTINLRGGPDQAISRVNCVKINDFQGGWRISNQFNAWQVRKTGVGNYTQVLYVARKTWQTTCGIRP